MQALIGIDIGTSGCKALLLDVHGAVIAADTATYPLSQPRPGWTEQDPELWIDGARRAIAGVLAKASGVELLGIGLSGQMHGLVPLDAAQQVLRPAILWNDQRNAAECEWITDTAGGLDGLLAATDNRMLVGYTGGKIVWMQRHEPELFARLTTVLNPKDYLRLRLTGEVASEVSDASGTGLFNVRSRQWASGLIEQLRIDPGLLPPVFESQVISARVSATGAALFGLPVGTPVAGGGGDSVIQTLGSGVIAPGELQTTIGTAGILAAALDEPRDNPDGRLQIFCNVAADKWHCMGVSLNAGGSMNWFRDTFCADASGVVPSFEQIVAEAAKSPAGAHGLLFLPYLNGERCPHPDPLLRAAFVGLTARHGRGDMARAVMEGAVHALADMHALMKPLGIDGHVIKASGGGARSPLWRQLQADIFGCDVLTTEGAAEGAAFGAALVAGLAVGVWADPASAAASCRAITRQAPDGATAEVFARAHRLYHSLYPTLRETFAELGAPIFD
ncbi:xylulokinase [Pseudomonas gingeri]|uniref:Xylulose kinase n=1 Tax=Pseudomonas gingeri TaxID=117681 RepID=A0A7Y7YDT1_9PSED|nr:xylulokinase [Pseudomonas gingeri]NWA02346.1 xylulokinase [Pseudomonas gingeri]NWA12481.1 xylulokinase [Pseudomonas gingeri]NWA57113.1 xylulokinase [Pseudomonas gingeri]NWA93456.1 xylulokinase [Pseudomonas gingeri]NWB02928.1 xylulokinase [Pseudomonas gingeri]